MKYILLVLFLTFTNFVNADFPPIPAQAGFSIKYPNLWATDRGCKLTAPEVCTSNGVESCTGGIPLQTGCVRSGRCTLNLINSGTCVVPARCPANATLTNGSCRCNSTFQENAEGNACEPIPTSCTPPEQLHVSLIDGRTTCQLGSTDSNACPDTAYGLTPTNFGNSGCTCREGTSHNTNFGSYIGITGASGSCLTPEQQAQIDNDAIQALANLASLGASALGTAKKCTPPTIPAYCALALAGTARSASGLLRDNKSNPDRAIALSTKPQNGQQLANLLDNVKNPPEASSNIPSVKNGGTGPSTITQLPNGTFSIDPPSQPKFTQNPNNYFTGRPNFATNNQTPTQTQFADPHSYTANNQGIFAPPQADYPTVYVSPSRNLLQSSQYFGSNRELTEYRQVGQNIQATRFFNIPLDEGTLTFFNQELTDSTGTIVDSGIGAFYQNSVGQLTNLSDKLPDLTNPSNTNQHR